MQLIYSIEWYSLFDEAKHKFDLMVNKNCLPDVVTNNILIKEFWKYKRLKDVMKLARDVTPPISDQSQPTENVTTRVPWMD